MLRSEPNSLKTGAVVVTRLGLSGDMVCVCVCVCLWGDMFIVAGCHAVKKVTASSVRT